MSGYEQQNINQYREAARKKLREGQEGQEKNILISRSDNVILLSHSPSDIVVFQTAFLLYMIYQSRGNGSVADRIMVTFDFFVRLGASFSVSDCLCFFMLSRSLTCRAAKICGKLLTSNFRFIQQTVPEKEESKSVSDGGVPPEKLGVIVNLTFQAIISES